MPFISPFRSPFRAYNRAYAYRGLTAFAPLSMAVSGSSLTELIAKSTSISSIFNCLHPLDPE
ncbi:MAG: hypothetical protein KZQ60_03170 [Candidatus Thiodiazotropha sp. (ex Lucinoma aequizonata)]|nr:hypothetical protein [Candidatus Thiodiazotropha sp. (ex Lucinoma aequizonata)]